MLMPARRGTTTLHCTSAVQKEELHDARLHLSSATTTLYCAVEVRWSVVVALLRFSGATWSRSTAPQQRKGASLLRC